MGSRRHATQRSQDLLRQRKNKVVLLCRICKETFTQHLPDAARALKKREVKGGHKTQGRGRMRRQRRGNEIPKPNLHLLSKAFRLKASLTWWCSLLGWSQSLSSSDLQIATQMVFPIIACVITVLCCHIHTFSLQSPDGPMLCKSSG